jgi:hypothetical protein
MAMSAVRTAVHCIGEPPSAPTLPLGVGGVLQAS